MSEKKPFNLIPPSWHAQLIETRNKVGSGCFKIGLVAVALLLATTICGPLALQNPRLIENLFTPPILTNDSNPISP